MVIIKSFQKWAVVFFTAALVSATHADTIILKDGTKIDGTVQSENSKEIVIEERISATITDIRTVPKAEIEKIEKTAQDASAYEAVKNLKPGVASLPATSYDQIIRALNNFVENYPDSSHITQVKEQISEWEAEKKRVDSGEVKLGGNWLSQEEAQKERYQINGALILSHMQQQHGRGDLAGALNSFEQLERNYPGARSFPDAVELAKQILPALRATAERMLQQVKFKDAEREKGIQLLSEPQRSQTLAAVQREKDQIEAATEAANRAGLKWKPLIAHEATLNDLANAVPDEQKRLAELPVANFRESIRLADAAKNDLAGKNFDEADQGIRKALELWSANELASRLQSEASTLRNASTSEESNSETAEQQPATSESAAPVLTSSESGSADAAPSATGANEAETNDTGGELVMAEAGFFQTPAGYVVVVILAIVALTVFQALRKVSKRASEVIE